MSATSPTRRDLIATSAVIGAVSLLPEHFAVAAESNAIRSFRINHVLKRGRQGRPLPRLVGAGALLRRGARRLQITSAGTLTTRVSI
jgi:hypothetical protein